MKESIFMKNYFRILFVVLLSCVSSSLRASDNQEGPILEPSQLERLHLPLWLVNIFSNKETFNEPQADFLTTKFYISHEGNLLLFSTKKFPDPHYVQFLQGNNKRLSPMKVCTLKGDEEPYPELFIATYGFYDGSYEPFVFRVTFINAKVFDQYLKSEPEIKNSIVRSSSTRQSGVLRKLSGGEYKISEGPSSLSDLGVKTVRFDRKPEEKTLPQEERSSSPSSRYHNKEIAHAEQPKKLSSRVSSHNRLDSLLIHKGRQTSKTQLVKSDVILQGTPFTLVEEEMTSSSVLHESRVVVGKISYTLLGSEIDALLGLSDLVDSEKPTVDSKELEPNNFQYLVQLSRGEDSSTEKQQN